MHRSSFNAYSQGRKIAVGFALSWVAMLGCGPASSRVEVLGDVTFEGKPLDEGTIVFVPLDSTPGPSAGASILQGKYQVPQTGGLLRNARYRVEITALAKTGRMIPSAMREGTPRYELAENFIPEQYNLRSNLTVATIDNPGPQRFDFDLVP